MAKWATITHDFPGSAIDGSFWTGGYGATASTQVASNKLSWTDLTSYSGWLTNGNDLIASSILIKVTVPTGGYAGFTMKSVASNTDIVGAYYYSSGPARYEGFYFGANYSGSTTSATKTTGLAADVWFKASEASGTVTIAWSHDGTTWTTLHSASASAGALTALASCKIQIETGPFPGSISARAFFSKLNLPPSGGAQALTGQIDVAVGATGTAIKQAGMTAAYAVVVGVTGTMAVARPLTGSSAVVVTLAGTPTVAKGLTGSSAVIVGASGTLIKAAGLTGTTAVSVGLTGTVRALLALAGSCAVVVNGTGTIVSQLALVGSSAVIITLSGSLAVARALAGTLAAQVGVTGTMVSQDALTGTCAVVVSLSGDLGGGTPIGNGQVDVLITLAGTLIKSAPLAGSSAVVVGPTGTLIAQRPLTGSLATVVGPTGSLVSQDRLAGSLATAVGVSGTMVSQDPVTGAVGTGVGVSGTLGVLKGMTGTIAVQVGTFGLLEGESSPPPPGLSQTIITPHRGRMTVAMNTSHTVVEET